MKKYTEKELKIAVEKEGERVYAFYLEEREWFRKRLKKLTGKFYDDLQETILVYEEELKKQQEDLI